MRVYPSEENSPVFPPLSFSLAGGRPSQPPVGFLARGAYKVYACPACMLLLSVDWGSHVAGSGVLGGEYGVEDDELGEVEGYTY